MTPPAYVLDPIAPATADELRRRGGPIYVADEHPGYPCRQCLRDAAVGDELILVSHDPFTVDSPYRSRSPIFLHRSPCDSHLTVSTLPDQLTIRTLSVRAFDADAMMLDASVIDGSDLDNTIRRMLGNSEVDRVHVHNAERGCWAVAVTRPR
jgi:hypothetical protein